MDVIPDVFCVPIKTKKKDTWVLIPHPLFGSGHYGVVYGACKREECAYVMKVIKLGKQTSLADFDQEVAIQSELAEHGLALPVEDSWKCRGPTKVGVIIMRSLDITVKDFLIQPITTEDVDVVISGVKKIMDNLHSLGYYHGDNHFANIMMKRISNGNGPLIDNIIKTSLGTYRLYLIDLGKSGRLDNPGTIRGKPVTKERRLKDDAIIMDGEIRQVMARLYPESMESIII
jgi:serine/threonine protein kinase